jgi:hypothetical protein
MIVSLSEQDQAKRNWVSLGTMAKENDLKHAKSLADAASAQAQAANRMWVAMMTIALFAVLPHPAGSTVSLPFGFGSVPVSAFYVVVYPLLVILVIAFSSAHSQQIMAQVKAQHDLKLDGSICGSFQVSAQVEYRCSNTARDSTGLRQFREKLKGNAQELLASFSQHSPIPMVL